MSKLCVYITLEHHKLLSWHSKNKKKSYTEIMKDAIDWFDPELHGPFVYSPSQHRVSRVVNIPDAHMEAVTAYSDAYELTDPKTISVIMWLYVSHHGQELKESKLEDIPSVLPLNIDNFIKSRLDGMNVSDTVHRAIVQYMANETYKGRNVSATRERGVTKNRINVYVKKQTKSKLLVLANNMRAFPQHIVADALAEYLGEGNEQNLF